jgi:hypothetical protein
MPTSTPTFSTPETVTIPGEVALEAVALLDAYANVLAAFRLDLEPEPFYAIEHPAWMTLLEALGHEPGADLKGPLLEAVYARSGELRTAIGSHFDGPALGAIATTKMAHDISEVKARLGYVRV